MIIFNNYYYLIITLWILNWDLISCAVVKKRQIYREQVLPHTGGKIPETAFQTDRLALNRLQKDGIAVPDGVILQQRDPQVFQYPIKAVRPVYKVQLTSDNRYTPSEGTYHHKISPSIDTTYSIPQHSSDNFPKIPIHRPLNLPNPYLKGHPYIQTISKSKPLIAMPPTFGYSYPYVDVHFGTSHLPKEFNLAFNELKNDYVASNIFNDFETFFNSFTHQLNYKTPSIYYI